MNRRAGMIGSIDRFGRRSRERAAFYIFYHIFSALPRGGAKKRQKFLPFPEIFSPESVIYPSDGTAATVSGYHFRRQSQPTEKKYFFDVPKKPQKFGNGKIFFCETVLLRKKTALLKIYKRFFAKTVDYCAQIGYNNSKKMCSIFPERFAKARSVRGYAF